MSLGFSDVETEVPPTVHLIIYLDLPSMKTSLTDLGPRWENTWPKVCGRKDLQPLDTGLLICNMATFETHYLDLNVTSLCSPNDRLT